MDSISALFLYLKSFVQNTEKPLTDTLNLSTNLNDFAILITDIKMDKVKQSRSTSWRRLGGEEI
jgi:hypothetical protein